MNSKIKNYVDVLFNDVPKTRKAVELKEEILADLNEHFEAHIAQGKSENQAYTEALADLGDIDELLSSLAPERELKPKIDKYRVKKARNTAIAVMLILLGVILLCALPSVSAVFSIGNPAKAGILGFVLMMTCIAIGIGLLIYTKMSVPQDVEPFLTHHSKEEFSGDSNGKFWASFFKLYWLIVTIIYLFVSFETGDWYITWIIWLIGSAVKHAIILFGGLNADECK